MLLTLSLLALAAWAAVLVLPWRPWSTRERLRVAPSASGNVDLSEITVLIPARNEANVIGTTLRALGEQGRGLKVIVVDDCSDDDTGARARRARPPGLLVTVLDGARRPAGWSGKLWALQQALREVNSRYLLLLDADIALATGVVAALLNKLCTDDRKLVSVMARLPTTGFWERLLVPPFVFFFKLLYPFSLVNRPASPVAAAAGGCVLLETQVLRDLGGFEPIRDALIDDCALAARVKGAGHAIWLGLSHAVTSQRGYPALPGFWAMVSRSAFTQLGYSVPRLLAASAIIVLMFLVPLVALLSTSWPAAWGGVTLALMAGIFAPVVRFHGLGTAWAATLPGAAILFLAMTWHSAWRYWRGTRALWKNRIYDVGE